MKTTIARKKFKNNFGQSNHFLITSLVALYYLGIDNREVACPPDFSTSWDPRNLKRSKDRTRNFLLKSYLAFAVDGVDLYLTELNRSPKFLDDTKFQAIFDEAGRSVFKKAMGIANYFKIDNLLTSSIDLLIAYRNNLLHYFAENEISDDHYECLKNKADVIHSKYSGLEILRLLENYKKGEAPTFKEVASLTRMSHDFVEAVDFQVINKLSPGYPLRAILIKLNELQVVKLKYLAGNSEVRIRIVKNILANYYSYNNDDFIDMDLKELITLIDSGVLEGNI